MKVLFVYLPFCTPASPPYSITHLASFLSVNGTQEIDVLDLNLLWHSKKFSQFQHYYQQKDWNDYDAKTKEFRSLTKQAYSANNKRVVAGEKPELFDEMKQAILDKKPDVVVFSVVYSSQAFFALALLQELGVKTIIGGPAVNQKLIDAADVHLNNEVELLHYLEGKEIPYADLKHHVAPNFSVYDLDAYFTPVPVVPLKTSTTCFYQQCTFCSHYAKTKYYEFPLEQICETVVQSGTKHFFLIDDMIPPQRLLDIAAVLKPLNVEWACQLRPRKEYTADVLQQLYDAGLRFVVWGCESGSDRILQLMKKGTNVADVEIVLRDSHTAGVKNALYIMFGFPTETPEEFDMTLDFLQRNAQHVDLVSPSVFGLQKGTPVYNDPAAFGIARIDEKERTVLEPKISYSMEYGAVPDARALRKKYKPVLDKVNKCPHGMNFFREHMFII